MCCNQMNEKLVNASQRFYRICEIILIDLCSRTREMESKSLKFFQKFYSLPLREWKNQKFQKPSRSDESTTHVTNEVETICNVNPSSTVKFYERIKKFQVFSNYYWRTACCQTNKSVLQFQKQTCNFKFNRWILFPFLLITAVFVFSPLSVCHKQLFQTRACKNHLRDYKKVHENLIAWHVSLHKFEITRGTIAPSVHRSFNIIIELNERCTVDKFYFHFSIEADVKREFLRAPLLLGAIGQYLMFC